MSSSLSAGSIAFTFFNADDGTAGEGFAFVAVDAIAAGTVIYFTDNEPNPGAASFNTGEGFLTWTAPTGGVAAGQEVVFTSTPGAGITVTAGSVIKAPVDVAAGIRDFDLSGTNEGLYAYQGTSVTTPTTYLSAIFNNTVTQTGGSLEGTGLTAGNNAVVLSGNVDVARYVGPTDFNDSESQLISRGAALAAINNTTTPVTGVVGQGGWITQDGGGDQAGDGTAPDRGDPPRLFEIICFYPGTLIATPDGPRAVETLAIGDQVLTSAGAAEPVRWMGRQTVSTRFGDALRVLPIRIRAGALADGIPARDLLVSPDHALLVGGILIQAGALVNGTSITRERAVPEVFTYHHVELATHDLILAEGAAAETFVDNVDRGGFDNWAEHQALYGHLPSIPEMAIPRAKAYRQVPARIHAWLVARAMALPTAA